MCLAISKEKVNIEDLINGQNAELERIGFKRGWNPEVVIRSLCAFGNPSKYLLLTILIKIDVEFLQKSAPKTD